jgi:hypothetical protein
VRIALGGPEVDDALMQKPRRIGAADPCDTWTADVLSWSALRGTRPSILSDADGLLTKAIELLACAASRSCHPFALFINFDWRLTGMLQISTGKFFKFEAHETLRRAIYYTNYRIFLDDKKIETQVGSIQSVTGVQGLGALTCEVIERIQKMPGGPYSGVIIATGGDTLINDFAAIVSFALNVTCTTDIDLARRLVSSERPSLGADLVPQRYIPRMFDRTVNWQPSDSDRLQRFVKDLMALERKSYEGAMRAIRRYVIGAHRISDDVNLAYALFVMSIESLAQKFDEFEPAWDDYDQNKRRRIEEALGEATGSTVDKVRAAILANEHVAIAMRFREFALSHVGPSFFREEAEKVVGAVSRPDLSIALRRAYSIRSSYVHHLEDIPRLLVGIEGFHEVMVVNRQPTLTFAGLSRVARHVIEQGCSTLPGGLN